MSNQNDLDDQLYILLASMKEYREAIADDKKRLETFYTQVASGVLDKAEKSLQETNKQAVGALKSRIQELDKATNRLNYQFIAVFASAFIALVMVLFLAIFLFIPSMDEIQQRRSEVNNLKNTA
jgi:CHASE3 domain sensor protein